MGALVGQIVRVREVVDRVVVEHDTPPVITEAEQRVIKTTTMQRGGKPGLPRPQVSSPSSEVSQIILHSFNE